MDYTLSYSSPASIYPSISLECILNLLFADNMMSKGSKYSEVPSTLQILQRRSSSWAQPVIELITELKCFPEKLLKTARVAIQRKKFLHQNFRAKKLTKLADKSFIKFLRKQLNFLLLLTQREQRKMKKMWKNNSGRDASNVIESRRSKSL